MSSSEINVDINHPGTAIASGVSYVTSAGLVVNQAWQFLNDYAAGVGAAIAILSYMTNLYFHCRNSKALADRSRSNNEL